MAGYTTTGPKTSENVGVMIIQEPAMRCINPLAVIDRKIQVNTKGHFITMAGKKVYIKPFKSHDLPGRQCEWIALDAEPHLEMQRQRIKEYLDDEDGRMRKYYGYKAEKIDKAYCPEGEPNESN